MSDVSGAAARRRALVSPDARLRLAALDDVAAAGSTLDEEDALAVVACLALGTKAVQRRAVDVLCAATAYPAVRARLRAALASAAVDERWGAAYALGRLDVFDRELVPVLVEALAHADGDRRWAAAALLVRRGERDADATVLPRLLAALREEPAELRRMALYVLRDLAAADASVASAFVAALGDADATVRLAALSALTRLASPPPSACTQVLHVLRRDPDPGVRRGAIAALGQLGRGNAEADAAIAAAERADDPATRRAAAAARRRLTRVL